MRSDPSRERRVPFLLIHPGRDSQGNSRRVAVPVLTVCWLCTSGRTASYCLATGTPPRSFLFLTACYTCADVCCLTRSCARFLSAAVSRCPPKVSLPRAGHTHAQVGGAHQAARCVLLSDNFAWRRQAGSGRTMLLPCRAHQPTAT